MGKKYKLKKRVVVIEEVDEEASLSDYLAVMVVERRKIMNMNQEKLAELTGISRASISNIEKGRHGLTLKNLEKLCEIFGCSSADLLPF